MRTALVLALLASACASSTVPASEACQEILGKRCDAQKACSGDDTACLTDEQQTCSKVTGELDSTQLEACLVALDDKHTCNGTTVQYQCSAADDVACMCLALYK